MNDKDINEIKHYLKNIEDYLEKLTRDQFLTNLFDNILSGVVSGIIVGLFLLFLK